MKQRAHKQHTPPTIAERYALRERIVLALLRNELTYGQALKRFRLELLGMKQAEFAQLVGLSRKVISDLENDKAVAVTSINQAFKPFGLHLNLVPRVFDVLQEMCHSYAMEQQN